MADVQLAVSKRSSSVNYCCCAWGEGPPLQSVSAGRKAKPHLQRAGGNHAGWPIIGWPTGQGIARVCQQEGKVGDGREMLFFFSHLSSMPGLVP